MFYINLINIYLFLFFDSKQFIFVSGYGLFDDLFLKYEYCTNYNNVFLYMLIIIIFFERLLWLFYVYTDKELIFKYWNIYIWLKFILILIFLLLVKFFFLYFYLYFQESNNEFTLLKIYDIFFDSYLYMPQYIKGFFNIGLIKYYSLEEKMIICRNTWNLLNNNNNITFFPESIVRIHVSQLDSIYDIKTYIRLLYKYYLSL